MQTADNRVWLFVWSPPFPLLENYFLSFDVTWTVLLLRVFHLTVPKPALDRRQQQLGQQLDQQRADVCSYLAQTGAPQVPQAEKTQSQNQKDQCQDQSQTPGIVEPGLLFFPSFNLRTTDFSD